MPLSLKICLQLISRTVLQLILIFVYNCVSEGADLESVTKAVKTYTNYGNKNKQSLAHLFVTLLVKVVTMFFYLLRILIYYYMLFYI
jgi:hypothetical protein